MEPPAAARYHPPPDLYPFRSRWLECRPADGRSLRLHYVDEGRGRPLLFLHGNPTWSFLYRGMMRRLRARFRCVAVDYPGFGLSEAPPGYGFTPREHAEAVRTLVSSLDLRDLVVVGHDWGGPIGVAVALAAVDRISGLVMGNTWCWPTERRANRLFARVMATPPARWGLLERNWLVERLLPLAVRRGLTERELEAYRAVQPSPEARRGAAELPRQLLRARSWLADLARRVPGELGDRPLLLTWGMRDLAFPSGHYVPRWRRRFEDCEFVGLESAGHFFPEDAPGAASDAISGWAAR